MKVHLPNSAFLRNIEAFLRGFDPADPGILEITADKKWISVHPVVISMVAALGARAGTGNVRCEKFEAKSGHYFERVGLFRLLGIPSGMSVTSHEEAGRFIPVEQIRTSEQQSRFITNVIPLLHAKEQYQADTIVYVLGELVRNVLEHADESRGAFVCAQYYRESNTIRIGIADTGIGIKASINAHHAAPDYAEAIRLALWPGITGTTDRIGGTDQNAGAGLFFIKSIASVNRDHFMLYSGDTLYKLHMAPVRKKIKLHPDPFDDKHKVTSGLPFWRGTAVGIDISLGRAQTLHILLPLLLTTLRKAVAERKHAKYKKPTFL